MPLQAGSDWGEIKDRYRETRGSFIDEAARPKKPPVVVQMKRSGRNVLAMSDAEIDRLLAAE